MPIFKISEIISATSGKLLQGNPLSSVRHVTTDSRLAGRGGLFIAIVGEKHDAHKFIPDVIKKGTVAIVVSQVKGPFPPSVSVIKVSDTTQALGDIARFHRQRFSGPVIAITGSAGKTTTKELMAALLRRKYKVLKNIGTENNQFGVPLTILKLKPSCDVVILEVGTNKPGDIAWLASIACPTVAVMTNIGESHLERLKTPAEVFKEKFHLVKALGKSGVVIFNNDDHFLKKISRLTRCKALTFAIKTKAKFQARQIEFKGNNVQFFVPRLGLITMPGTATAHVYNALASITCARLFKVSDPQIIAVVKKFSLKSGRQTAFKVGKISVINDSYNANPVSFRSALEGMTHYETSGRKILLCGDMLELGSQAKHLHQQIGEYASRVGLSTIISFGHFSQWIGLAAQKRREEIELFHSSRAEDIEAALKKYLHPSDLVLVKGSRGMQTERFVEFIKANF